MGEAVPGLLWLQKFLCSSEPLLGSERCWRPLELGHDLSVSDEVLKTPPEPDGPE